jgi:hypothetical protein
MILFPQLFLVSWYQIKSKPTPEAQQHPQTSTMSKRPPGLRPKNIVQTYKETTGAPAPTVPMKKRPPPKPVQKRTSQQIREVSTGILDVLIQGHDISPGFV